MYIWIYPCISSQKARICGCTKHPLLPCISWTQLQWPALRYISHQVDNYLYLQCSPHLWTILRRSPLIPRSLSRDLLPSIGETSSLIPTLKGKFQGRNYHEPCLTGMTSSGCSILYLMGPLNALLKTHGLSITISSQRLLVSLVGNTEDDTCLFHHFLLNNLNLERKLLRSKRSEWIRRGHLKQISSPPYEAVMPPPSSLASDFKQCQELMKHTDLLEIPLKKAQELQQTFGILHRTSSGWVTLQVNKALLDPAKTISQHTTHLQAGSRYYIPTKICGIFVLPLSTKFFSCGGCQQAWQPTSFQVYTLW